MDSREREGNFEVSLLAALGGLQAKINTCLPCTVVSFNPVKATCVLQPAIQYQFRQQSGDFVWVTLPLLLDCPVWTLRGGPLVITMPIAAGDDAVCIFSQRCLDAWWQNGGVQPQAEFRMHDLSDGFCFVGPCSLPQVPGGWSTTAAQLRTTDGETFVEVGPGKIQLVADEVIIHGRNKTTFDAGGTGFVYTPTKIDTYTNGVTTVAHPPNPPEVPT